MLFLQIWRPVSCVLSFLILLACSVSADEQESLREKRHQLLRQFRLAQTVPERRAILEKLIDLQIRDRPSFNNRTCVDESGSPLTGSGLLAQEMLAFLKHCAYRPETRSQTIDRFLYQHGFKAVKAELEKYLGAEDSSLRGAARRVYERALVAKMQAPLEGLFSIHLQPKEETLPLEEKIDLLLERLDPNPSVSGDPIAALRRTASDRSAVSLLETWSAELLTPAQKAQLASLSRDRRAAESDLRILDRLRRSACSHLKREVEPYLSQMMEQAYLETTRRLLMGDSWMLVDNQIYRWGILRTQRWSMADSPGLHRVIGEVSAGRYRALSRFDQEIQREKHRPGSTPKRKARLQTLRIYQNWSGSTLSGTWGTTQSLQSVIEAARETARRHGVHP